MSLTNRRCGMTFSENENYDSSESICFFLLYFFLLSSTKCKIFSIGNSVQKKNWLHRSSKTICRLNYIFTLKVWPISTNQVSYILLIETAQNARGYRFPFEVNKLLTIYIYINNTILYVLCAMLYGVYTNRPTATRFNYRDFLETKWDIAAATMSEEWTVFTWVDVCVCVCPVAAKLFYLRNTFLHQ